MNGQKFSSSRNVTEKIRHVSSHEYANEIRGQKTFVSLDKLSSRMPGVGFPYLSSQYSLTLYIGVGKNVLEMMSTDLGMSSNVRNIL